MTTITETTVTTTTTKLEYISEKQFWVLETPTLPMFDWDLKGGLHPTEACTINTREEVIPRLEEYCASHPEAGFYLEKTPGGVRGFFNKPLTLEEWREIYTELGCDPLMSQLQEGWWTPRVSPKPGLTWTSKPWTYIGEQGSNEENYNHYRKVVEDMTEGQWVDTLYVRKHSAEWTNQSIIWAQIEGWAEARLGYGEHLFILKICPINIKAAPNRYLMGNTDTVGIPEGYTYGVEDLEEEYGETYKGIHWVSMHSSLVKTVEYVGEDPTYQAEMDAWQAQLAQLAQQEAQPAQPKKSILEQIKEKWGKGSADFTKSSFYFTHKWVSFVFDKETEEIKSADEPADEEEEEYINSLITEMWSELKN